MTRATLCVYIRATLEIPTSFLGSRSNPSEMYAIQRELHSLCPPTEGDVFWELDYFERDNEREYITYEFSEILFSSLVS